jgi:hypothetical protein
MSYSCRTSRCPSTTAACAGTARGSTTPVRRSTTRGESWRCSCVPTASSATRTCPQLRSTRASAATSARSAPTASSVSSTTSVPTAAAASRRGRSGRQPRVASRPLARQAPRLDHPCPPVVHARGHRRPLGSDHGHSTPGALADRAAGESRDCCFARRLSRKSVGITLAPMGWERSSVLDPLQRSLSQLNGERSSSPRWRPTALRCTGRLSGFCDSLREGRERWARAPRLRVAHGMS